MKCLDTGCLNETTEYCPLCPEEIAYQTEVIVNGKIYIPDVKPPSEKPILVHRKIFIRKAEALLVKLDNGCIAGCKILVTGSIRLGIEYSANVPEQNVHFVHTDIPFQGLIMGGPCDQPIPLYDCDLRKFHINICVEHIQLRQLDCRTFEKVIVLMIWLERKEPCPPQPCPPPLSPPYPYPPPPYSPYQYPPMPYTSTPCPPHPYPPPPCPPEPCPPYPYPPPPCPPKPCPPDPCPPDCCTPCPPDISKELSINHLLTLPCAKPPIECILSSKAEIEITNALVIKTPLVSGPCSLPVRKVVLAGSAHIIIKYAADVASQAVHAADFCIPFSGLIEWPGGPPPYTPICVEAIEEHFNVDILSPTSLFATLIIRVDVYQN